MTHDWAAKAARNVKRKGCGCEICWLNNTAIAIRRAQAQERARWRQAIKTLKAKIIKADKKHSMRYAQELAYRQALADLAQAMKGRKG